MKRLPLLLLAAAAATGCSDSNIRRFDIVDVWHQNPPDEVDILMVVDDSCSMDPYQARLGSNFETFISYFIEADVDYQIGVVTTDVMDPRKSGKIQGEIITPETSNPAGVFSQHRGRRHPGRWLRDRPRGGEHGAQHDAADDPQRGLPP